MINIWKEFQTFAARGNLVQLAVAFIFGIAFAAVVTSMVDDIFMPIIGAIVSDRTFAALTLEVGGAEIRYGNFIAVLINFILIAAILFAIVQTYMQVQRKEEAVITTKPCLYCMTEVPLAATRCPACTSQLEPA